MQGLLTRFKQRWLSHKLWIMYKQSAEVHCNEITDCRCRTNTQHADKCVKLLNRREKSRPKKRCVVNCEPLERLTQKIAVYSSAVRRNGLDVTVHGKGAQNAVRMFRCERKGLLLWKPSCFESEGQGQRGKSDSLNNSWYVQMRGLCPVSLVCNRLESKKSSEHG